MAEADTQTQVSPRLAMRSGTGVGRLEMERRRCLDVGRARRGEPGSGQHREMSDMTTLTTAAIVSGIEAFSATTRRGIQPGTGRPGRRSQQNSASTGRRLPGGRGARWPARRRDCRGSGRGASKVRDLLSGGCPVGGRSACPALAGRIYALRGCSAAVGGSGAGGRQSTVVSRRRAAVAGIGIVVAIGRPDPALE